MVDEHRGSNVMQNVTKIYQKKHVTDVWLTTVLCHSTTVHAGNVQCLDKSLSHNTFHSTTSTTTFKIKISVESIQKEFQIMIMKKNFGKNKKIKFVIFCWFSKMFNMHLKHLENSEITSWNVIRMIINEKKFEQQ